MAGRRSKHPDRDRVTESELKFRLAGASDHARLRTRLRQIGAQLEGTYDEENIRFRHPGHRMPVTLRLRIIDGGPGGVLTTKGQPRFVGRIKIRVETEAVVADVDTMRDLLLSLGYEVAFTYRKHRATYELDGIAITLDTLDFGFFIEVEGDVERIEDVAVTLGLNPRQGLKASYSDLARRHLAGSKQPPVPTVSIPV